METRLENIPAELRAHPQWVLWRMEPPPGEKKPTKVPYNARTGGRASAKHEHSDTWNTFDVAVAALNAPSNNYTGIGLVFALDDEYAGMDIDDCRNPDTCEIAPWAMEYIERLNSYTEVSPSGTGVKIWVKATKKGGGSRKAPFFEMYDQDRYFTVTGQHLEETPCTVEDRDDEYNAIHAELFPPPAASAPLRKQTPSAPLMSEGDLLDKASKAANGPLFNRLRQGDWSSYGSQSEADIAYCGFLAFWTGNDAAQVDSLFRQSGLMRPKWDERHHSNGDTYGQGTVARACQGTNCYDPERGRGSVPMGHTSVEEAAEWEPPVPFSADGLPSFPVDALPKPLADYVSEVAAVKQVPVDLPAMMSLAVTAAAGAGRCEVQIGGDGYTEPLNIYQASFMEPGSRKSSALAAMAYPLREAEREKVKELEPQIAAARERLAIHERRLEILRNKVAKEQNEDECRVLMNEIEGMTEEPPLMPVQPYYLTEDVTPERMAGLLAEQKGVMAILSAEGGLFGMLAGRYSPNANIDIFLKGHSGEDYRVDRIGRPSEFIPKATLTLGLTVQPDILRSLAQSQEFRGRGLIARFLFSLPNSLVGTRLSQKGRSIDPQAERRYSRAIRSILDLPTAATEDNPGARHPLLITGDAWDVWAAGADDVERRQADGGDLAGIRDWASKLAGAVARIAGGFHLIQEATSGTPWAKPICAETVAAAWRIGHCYLIPHALAVFGQMGADPNQALAYKLLGFVQGQGWLTQRQASPNKLADDQFSLYECQRAYQTASKDALKSALEVLRERNYIRPDEAVRSTNRGRPKGETYRVNPALLHYQGVK